MEEGACGGCVEQSGASFVCVRPANLGQKLFCRGVVFTQCGQMTTRVWVRVRVRARVRVRVRLYFGFSLQNDYRLTREIGVVKLY